jgi:hypothetical protein
VIGGGFNFLDYFRSLSFGGLLGALIVGLVYLKFPYFQAFTGLKGAMFFGGVIGAGTQRAIQAVITFIIYPIGRFITYYEQLIELGALHAWGKISDDEYKTISSKLTESRFLGAPLRDKPETPKAELPPKP